MILQLLRLDRNAYLSLRPHGRPMLPSRVGHGEFRMVDFLTFAGVDPYSRGQ